MRAWLLPERESDAAAEREWLACVGSEEVGADAVVWLTNRDWLAL
jgi:hypothetical protein